MNNADITHQIEPCRKSFFDVLQDNLNAANKIAYVHRLIYIGEHMCNVIPGRSIGRCMEKTINKVNSGYNDSALTGILLCYPKYFCHILEGSEDSLAKHLLLLTTNEDNRKRLGRMRILVCYHHINQRFVQGWFAFTGNPPTLLEKIDINSDLSRTSRYVFNCIQKLCRLALLQRRKMGYRAQGETRGGRGSIAVGRFTLAKKIQANISSHTGRNSNCLPEYGLLEFLLSTPYTQDLQHYVDIYGVIPVDDHFKDKIWPVPSEFIPYYIFENVPDPVPNLPTAEPEEVVDTFQTGVE